MKITRLEKTALLGNKTVTISLDIELTQSELDQVDYRGFDLFPDYLIADLLVAVGRKYKGKIKKGKLKEIAGWSSIINLAIDYGWKPEGTVMDEGFL